MDTNEVLVEERRRQLLARLRTEGRLVASAEAERFAVSEDTIKRDLRHLASLGQLTRVRGGALPSSPSTEPYPQRTADPSLSLMAQAVARRLVETGGVVVIDAGTSNLEVVRALPDGAELTVVTSAPAIADAASTRGIRVLMLGGVIEPAIGAAVGAAPTAALRGITADLAILGACAVHPTTGVTATRADEVEFKRAVIDAGAEVMVIAGSTKLGAVAPFHVAEVSTIDIIATDADDERLGQLTEAGLEVLHV